MSSINHPLYGDKKYGSTVIIDQNMFPLYAYKLTFIHPTLKNEMTFEKKNSLDEYIKQGVKVDAPVSSELLTTIFYPGTTLHDGAVVIRGTNIERKVHFKLFVSL